MAEDKGIGRAGIAAVMGIALAVAGPYALVDVNVTWQRIVMLSLLLLCVLMLVATVVLAGVAEMCGRRGAASAERMLMICDIFLFSSAGAMAVTSVFAFVFAILRLVM